MVRQAHHDRHALSLSKGNLMGLLHFVRNDTRSRQLIYDVHYNFSFFQSAICYLQSAI